MIKSEKKKIEESANFYSKFLNIDHLLLLYSFETLKKYFRGTVALEIGPAYGGMTKLLKDEFSNLHLIEGSKKLLDQIPNYNNIVKFHNLIEEYSTETKYDTIIMSHVLEHIANPIIVLKKIHSLLKPDGVFLVSVPNAKSLHRMVAKAMGLLSSEYDLNERDHELGHYRVYDLEKLKRDLLHAKFKINHSGGYFLKPLSNGQIEQNWNQDMIDGFYNVGTQFQENCAEIYAVCSINR